MFAIYDYSNFPNIVLELSGSLITDNDFHSLIDPWIELYDKQIEFTFEIHTKNINGYINPKYCLSMAFFIKKLKKRDKQYLKDTIIYVNNKYLKQLLLFIFYIEKPVSKIDIKYYNFISPGAGSSFAVGK